MGIAGRGEAKEEWGGAMGVHMGAAAVVFLVVLREILAAAGFLSQEDQVKLICCLVFLAAQINPHGLGSGRCSEDFFP